MRALALVLILSAGCDVADETAESTPVTASEGSLTALSSASYAAYVDDYLQNRTLTQRAAMTPMPGVSQDADGTWIVSGSNVTIRDRVFYNQRPGKPALIVRGASSVVIENCLFWGGFYAAEGGTAGLATTTVAPRNGWGIRIERSNDVRVHRNFFENVERAAIWVQGTPGTPMSGIMIYKNRILNLQAWDVTNGASDPAWPFKWEAKGIQLFDVQGENNLVWENRIVNLPGLSFSTDFINLFQSGGTAASPLRITGNKIVGAGPVGSYHQWGAGIQLGDHAAGVSGGDAIVAEYNTLVYPGRAGMNINGGTHMTLRANTILMPPSLYGYDMNCDPAVTGRCEHRAPAFLPRKATLPPWTAMSAVNYSGGATSAGHTVQGNTVDCTGCDASHYFEAGSGVVETGNQWQATIDPLAVAPPAGFFAFAAPTAANP